MASDSTLVADAVLEGATVTCCRESRRATTTSSTPRAVAIPTLIDPLRRSKLSPVPTSGPFHLENRRLRVSELRRLFTCPDDFELVGRRASVQAQIGNSVPPPLAKIVADLVAAVVT
jgi:site-specific DNA-cytosine methylase